MGKIEYWCIVIFVLAFLLALFFVIFSRVRTKNILDKIDDMLSKAVNGEFSESTFDESKLSRLESKFSGYLSGMEASSRKLLQDKQNINTLISDISHQTKTPLANILLYTQLLSEHNGSVEGEVCIKELSRQAKKLSFLIESLIKASRLENGIIVVKPENNSLQSLLEEVRKQAEGKAKNKSIELVRGEWAGQAKFDFKWTVEAVYNVLDNAIKYSPSNRKISIHVTELEMYNRIEISDQGIGIDESEHEKIFLRFYRSPELRAEEGVGIGLFLTREILAAQGGYIVVKSKRGEGSSFYIFLPK